MTPFGAASRGLPEHRLDDFGVIRGQPIAESDWIGRVSIGEISDLAQKD